MLKRENRLSKLTRKTKEKKYFSLLFTVGISEGKDDKARFGFVVSKKIDRRAVVRNRTKRVLQKAAEHFLKDLTGKEIVIIAKKELDFKNLAEIVREFKNIFGKI